MTETAAAEVLKAVFNDDERRFLLSHPKFKKALRRATKDCVFELADFGMKILLREACRTPASSPNPPIRKPN